MSTATVNNLKKVKKDAELKDRFWEAAEIFEKDPFHPRLRIHKRGFIFLNLSPFYLDIGA
jgi:hypothetical protein